MTKQNLNGVTQLMDRWSNGEQQAFDELVTVVYNELSRKAHQLMMSERSGHMLQTSALVHEAYLCLKDMEMIQWQGRSHFFAVTAGVMRRILVDQARARNALKRGGDMQQVTLDENSVSERGQDVNVDMLALDEALKNLSKMDNLQARIVELRFFAGITVEETAAVLGISAATVKRKWILARSQLYHQLNTMAA